MTSASHRHWFAQLHMGRPGPLSKPIDGYLAGLNDVRRRDLAQTLECSAIGDKEAVGEWLTDFIKQTGADEVMIDTLSHAAAPISTLRKRSRSSVQPKCAGMRAPLYASEPLAQTSLSRR